MAPANKSTQSLSFSHLTRRDHLSTFFWPHLYITQFKGNTLPVPAGTSSIISYTPKLNLVSPLSPVPLTPDYSTLFIQRNVPKSSGRCLAERSRQARLGSTHGLNSRLHALTLCGRCVGSSRTPSKYNRLGRCLPPHRGRVTHEPHNLRVCDGKHKSQHFGEGVPRGAGGDSLTISHSDLKSWSTSTHRLIDYTTRKGEQKQERVKERNANRYHGPNVENPRQRCRDCRTHFALKPVRLHGRRGRTAREPPEPDGGRLRTPGRPQASLRRRSESAFPLRHRAALLPGHRANAAGSQHQAGLQHDTREPDRGRPRGTRRGRDRREGRGGRGGELRVGRLVVR